MEALHAWRKRVKDLWYHCRLLAPTCGPMVRGHAKDLDRLAKLLGDDHDLAVLEQELTRPDISIAADVDAVVQLIDYRRTELQSEATGIGERVYAESPKAFRAQNAPFLEGRAQAGSGTAGAASSGTGRGDSVTLAEAGPGRGRRLW